MKVRQIIMVILLSHIWNHIYSTLNNILEMQRFVFFFSSFHKGISILLSQMKP